MDIFKHLPIISTFLNVAAYLEPKACGSEAVSQMTSMDQNSILCEHPNISKYTHIFKYIQDAQRKTH